MAWTDKKPKAWSKKIDSDQGSEKGKGSRRAQSEETRGKGDRGFSDRGSVRGGRSASASGRGGFGKKGGKSGVFTTRKGKKPRNDPKRPDTFSAQ